MAAFQSTLTDFSSPFRPATGLYFGAPIWQLTATGSGSSSSSVVAFATKAKQGTGSGAGSATAIGVRVVGRTATGSAIGAQVAVISGPTQLRLGAVTDFSFPYLTGGRFYLGPAYYLRTASGSGTGSQSIVSIHVVVRSATGSGFAGASTSTDLEILFRSATGSATSSSEADPFLFVIRQASGSGAGTSSSVFRRELLRATSGTGNGTSSATRLVKNIRTAIGSGAGSAVAIRLVSTIRTATASGIGTASSTSIELLPRTASGSGAGATSGDAVGYKFHMFRPPTQNDVPTQLVNGDRIANRLARFYAPGRRGKNVYKLVDSTFTEIDQHDYSIVVKVYHGGHVHQLTEEEYTDLLAAGYSEYLT